MFKATEVNSFDDYVFGCFLGKLPCLLEELYYSAQTLNLGLSQKTFVNPNFRQK